MMPLVYIVHCNTSNLTYVEIQRGIPKHPKTSQLKPKLSYQ